MIALGRWEEFNLHVEAAFNNGLTEDDLKEVIMHAACYCGVPAGNHAFAQASETLNRLGRPPKPLPVAKKAKAKAKAKPKARA
jgi:alkylhydroperoxidase/carboxymuconolactone decarboxylase family protein YurZ